MDKHFQCGYRNISEWFELMWFSVNIIFLQWFEAQDISVNTKGVLIIAILILNPYFKFNICRQTKQLA